MKKKNIVVDKIPEEYMIESLGSGVSAECFLTSEGKVFKDLIVVSYNEIENDVELQSIGMVTV